MPNPDLSDSENEEQDDLAGQKDDLAGQKDELVEGSEITDDMFEDMDNDGGNTRNASGDEEEDDDDDQEDDDQEDDDEDDEEDDDDAGEEKKPQDITNSSPAFVIKGNGSWEVPTMDEQGLGRIRDYGDPVVVESFEDLAQMKNQKGWLSLKDIPTSKIVVVRGKFVDENGKETTALAWYAYVVVRGSENGPDRTILRAVPIPVVKKLIDMYRDHPILDKSSLLTNRFLPGFVNSSALDPQLNKWKKASVKSEMPKQKREPKQKAASLPVGDKSASCGGSSVADQLGPESSLSNNKEAAGPAPTKTKRPQPMQKKLLPNGQLVYSWNEQDKPQEAPDDYADAETTAPTPPKSALKKNPIHAVENSASAPAALQDQEKGGGESEKKKRKRPEGSSERGGAGSSESDARKQQRKKPAEKPAEKPVEKPAEKPVEKPADKPAEMLVDEPAEMLVDEPAEVQQYCAGPRGAPVCDLANTGCIKANYEHIKIPVTPGCFHTFVHGDFVHVVRF